MKKPIAVAASVAAVAALAVPGMSSGQGSSLPTLRVAVGDGTIALTGTPQSGATTVSITNSSAKKPASVTLFRFAPGATYEQTIAAAAKAGEDPNPLSKYGQIVFDYSVDPGKSATIDTVLPAGSYSALESSGRNPAKYPHTEFTVGQAASEAALPPAAKTITSIDFGFKAPKRLKSGSTVRFRQEGNVMHMIAAVKVQNAFVARKAVKYLKAGKDRKVRPLAQGFAGFLDPASGGAVQQEKVTAAPGTYVLACFLPTQDGRPHTRLGMAKAIRITK